MNQVQAFFISWLKKSGKYQRQQRIHSKANQKKNNNTCYCIDSIQDNWSRQQLQNKTTVKTTNFNRIIGFMCYAYDSTTASDFFCTYMKIEILFRAISFRSSSFSVRYMSMCFFAIHHSIIEHFLSGHEFTIWSQIKKKDSLFNIVLCHAPTMLQYLSISSSQLQKKIQKGAMDENTLKCWLESILLKINMNKYETNASIRFDSEAHSNDFKMSPYFAKYSITTPFVHPNPIWT